MAWIESHQELRDHLKTKRAAKTLGIGVPQMIGHLHLLWWWAYDQAPDGNLTGLTNEEISEGAQWDGDADRFVSCLVGCGVNGGPGFLESPSEGVLKIHDWEEYALKHIRQRERAAHRQRRYRDVTATLRERRRDVPSAPDLTGPDLTGPNTSVPSVSSGTPVAKASKDDNTELAFDGEYFSVTSAFVAHLKTTYPAVDTLATIRRAHGWLVANPERRKKRPARFLDNWFSRSQDSGGRHPPVVSGIDRQATEELIRRMNTPLP